MKENLSAENDKERRSSLLKYHLSEAFFFRRS